MTKKTSKIPLTSDLQLAAAVQSALLSENGFNSDFGRMVVRNRMCSAVGGDFYHVRSLAQDQLAFAIGDVVGHGLGAALIMSLILGILRADRLDNRRPVRVVEGINQMLLDLGARVDIPLICSLIYGVVDLPSGLLLYVNAGHPLPLISNRLNGCWQLLPPTTMLLGVQAQQMDESCHQFAADDRLVLFTDGISETRNHQEERFGEDRLRQIICSRREASPEEVISQVFQQTDSFRGGPPDDDETIVLIDFNHIMGLNP